MQNTPEIQASLRQLVADMGSQRAVADKIGLSRGAFGDWLTGKAKTIRLAHWQKVKPLLKPYLPAEPAASVNEYYEPYNSSAVDPLCRDIIENWDKLDPAAQIEILGIVAKYRR